MKHLHSHTLRASQFFIFLFSFFIFFLASCIKDDTTLADRALTEIRIDSTSIAPVYNIDKNEVLRITPRITQTGDALDVTYTWEVNQEEYSHDPVFEYPARSRSENMHAYKHSPTAGFSRAISLTSTSKSEMQSP